LTVTDKAKATAATSVAVFHDNCFFDGAEFGELRSESILVSVPRKAANEELRHDEYFSKTS
jgi:hypothetical protein